MPLRKQQRRGAAIVLWAVGLLAASHVLLAVYFGLKEPMLRDVECHLRFKKLHQRVGEAPDRPLLLALGSSRMLTALAADDLSARDGDGVSAGGSRPLVFNMGLTGAGPANELICLRRVLECGVRPRAVVIEVLPRTLCPQPDDEQIAEEIPDVRRTWSDRELLAPKERLSCLTDQLTPPWYAHRFYAMSRIAPNWLSIETRKSFYKTTDHGWAPWGVDQVTPEQYAAGLAGAFKQHGAWLQFTAINRKADQLLRLLFDECRQNGIEVLGLIVMPESSEFRGWYQPATRELIDHYLTQLCREHGTRYVNAREWLPDKCFADGHHPLPATAHEFTARFWSEIVEPCVR